MQNANIVANPVQVDQVEDEEAVVQEEEVGIEQAKLQDIVQVEVVDMAQAKLQDQVKEDWAEEQRMHEVEAVDVAKAKLQDSEVREDWLEEHLVNFVGNEAESKINMSDMYSKLL